MGFNCGIVGLPNVGKSTLFNALTATAAAAAANYPFCTIEPNVGRVPVPDARLGVLARIAKSPQVIATQLEIKDIAGLVRGASKGEGLGNKFLGAIREVDAILHVLRCFRIPTSFMSKARSIPCATPNWSKPSCCWPTLRASSGRRRRLSNAREARTRKPRRGSSCSSISSRPWKQAFRPAASSSTEKRAS